MTNVKRIHLGILLYIIMDPWTKKNRVFWKKDPTFTKFNEKLYEESLTTFDKTWKFCGVDKWDWKNKDWVQKAADDWKKLSKRWKKDNPEKKLLDFAAITLLFTVLPYDKLNDLGRHLTAFEANNINIAYFYEIGQCRHSERNLSFRGIQDMSGGPIHPAAYVNWLEEKYNHASWWITYMVYEKLNGLEPVITSEPATWLSLS